MHSTKTLLIAVLVIAAVAFATGFLLRDGDNVDNTDPTPVPMISSTPSTTPQAAAPTRTPVIHTIRLTAAGPVPKTLTVIAGDGVQFTNESDTAYWVASDPHPAHDQCPGLDARRSLGRGERYGLAFPAARTCGYHNHLDPLNNAFRGTIVVQ